ncbi:MAG TPA: hypothetical protein VMZ71_13720, partial [Gemmataceae bacterium]|nr:hypothetical protein [Gemmataceae bacterium]
MDTAVRRQFSFVIAACVVLLAGGSAIAQTADDGLFVSVHHPVTSLTVSSIKSTINVHRNSASAARKLGKVVFDFNPGTEAKAASSIDFGACYDLASYINGLSEIQTIAFVHGKVTGHTVLPVLACKELVMSRENDTALGAVAGENGATLRDTEKYAYRQLFDRPAQVAIVEKMFDRDVVLAKTTNIKQGGAVWYVDSRKMSADYTRPQPVAFAPPGELGLFTADQAKELGLSKATASTRGDVGELYGIPNHDDDPLRGTPDPYRHTLKGDVDGAMREALVRIVKGVKAKKGNVLILTLECGGTDLQAARTIADDLQKARTGEDAIKIIAFIPDRANDAA